MLDSYVIQNKRDHFMIFRFYQGFVLSKIKIRKERKHWDKSVRELHNQDRSVMMAFISRYIIYLFRYYATVQK